MNRFTHTMIGLLAAAACTLGACAEVKHAGRTVGHTTRDVTRDIGHGTRDAAKDVAKGTKRVVKEATKDDDKQ